MAKEYRGDEYLFLVEIPPETTGEAVKYRFFNQTDGSISEESDAIELKTKDKSGSDYGDGSISVSLEGIITEGDSSIDYIKKSRRQKKFVKIYEVNTRTKKAEWGMYMISTFERTYSNGEFAKYSLEAALNGELTEETLTEIPTGAPSEAGV
ncbi:phage major tail protein, TP901-1 family [Bacillus toyonensis]|uniref:phage major tail protein, TP901-1 family n=1 Tax=Bacillus toyonensis TaxID=155322 RepID=UPI000BEFA61C|nr:phage major tail protein, TP901-1 family [Bacillus toyonensis]PEK78326.1 phage major tail protein, TP901-1 family [Bacillus toyonensis]PEO51227.1 phage major tail protein, TP901-1 family [Bacillus toyonensis]PFY36888.1 phage major tail protein, TP901-1 family [Bacillus toyonensis]PFY43851.1 phage major tail protein, TP901-1 family [Bacillus toyonensis]PFY73574.1 phage major tail protein, TP901-1 family [Bacillus toyonensis]